MEGAGVGGGPPPARRRRRARGPGRGGGRHRPPGLGRGRLLPRPAAAAGDVVPAGRDPAGRVGVRGHGRRLAGPAGPSLPGNRPGRELPGRGLRQRPPGRVDGGLVRAPNAGSGWSRSESTCRPGWSPRPAGGCRSGRTGSGWATRWTGPLPGVAASTSCTPCSTWCPTTVWGRWSAITWSAWSPRVGGCWPRATCRRGTAPGTPTRSWRLGFRVDGVTRPTQVPGRPHAPTAWIRRDPEPPA
jgi:hypothetical protein